jgi:hypothetical protein
VPPGINPKIPVSRNKSLICLNSSSGWLLKKKSKLKKKEILNISKFFSFSYENKISRIGLIEDKFDSGFKLRLIQMLFNCDYIITKLDYSHEILALGCDPHNTFIFDDFSKINFEQLEDKYCKNINSFNKKTLLANHLWQHKSKILLEILN